MAWERTSTWIPNYFNCINPKLSILTHADFLLQHMGTNWISFPSFQKLYQNPYPCGLKLQHTGLFLSLVLQSNSELLILNLMGQLPAFGIEKKVIRNELLQTVRCHYAPRNSYCNTPEEWENIIEFYVRIGIIDSIWLLWKIWSV